MQIDSVQSSVGRSIVDNQYKPTMSIEPYVDNVICTDGTYCYAPRALNITCKCKRILDTIDQSVQHIYKAILIDENIGELLQSNPGGCQGINVGGTKGHCGNMRGWLNECRCYLLNRKIFPGARKHYEDLIVDAAEQILKSTTICTNDDSLNIAMFASGGLHSELVLMVKLLNRLRIAHFEGTVNLFLIDIDYKVSIQQAYTFINSPQGATTLRSFKWNNYLGQREDLEQFLRELSLGLPPKIQLNVHMFGEAEDYILRAQHDTNFRHDLLVGADIEMTKKDSSEMEAIVLKLKSEARRHDRLDQPGFVLVKKDGTPQVCSIRSDLSKPACTPIPLPTPLVSCQNQRQNQPNCIIS
jgi:hypothetical protein